MTGRRLRVLHLIDQLNPGGAERFTMQVVARLDGERFDRTLCGTRATEDHWPGDSRADALGALEAAGVRILQLHRTGRWDLRAWRPLAALLRRGEVDVLHAHMFGSSLWGTVLGRAFGVPVLIAHEHGSPAELTRARRALERHVIGRGADAYLAVSETDRRAIVARGVPEHRTRVLPNGIATPELPTGADPRAELGLPAGAPVIGTVGVLRPEKAQDVLLRAAAIVRAEHPDLRVVVIGYGPRREALERLAAELGLADAVTFTGMRTDVPALLGALDVAVVSSEREGSPLAVMEYMEAGLPVVSTRVGGIPEIVRDGREGVLVAPGDVPALAGAIGDLLRDPERARELGRAGRERRRQHFDLDVTARRLGDLYEELWAARRR